MDRPTFLEEVQAGLVHGTRLALATLRRYEDGWVIHRIVEQGRPDVEERVDVFPTRASAAKAAEKIWIP